MSESVHERAEIKLEQPESAVEPAPPASRRASTILFATVENEPTRIEREPIKEETGIMSSTFDLFIKGYTIGVPRPKRYLPLPVPIPYPAIFSKRNDTSYLSETILRDVDVNCGSGEVLAIIGGSGSGKTTLLSAIVGRLANLPVRKGELSFAPTSLSAENPELLSAQQMKDKIGFVPQNDYLLPNLTVRETLHYAAELRLPSTIDHRTRTAIVNQTLEELGLTDAADTVIGGFGNIRKGISGGERRRVTIACILVALPSVIVLDEPTSGLDAFTASVLDTYICSSDLSQAYQLLLTLSELAKRNRTIILSLHQPRSDAFALFTRLLVLSKGSVVYSGLTSQCLPWFASHGLEPDTGVNPLDFLIDISSVEIGEDEKREASKARVERLVTAWKENGAKYSADKSKRWTRREKESRVATPEPTAANQSLKRFFSSKDGDPALRRPGMVSQTLTLLSRANKNTLRNHGQTLGYAVQAILIGVVLGWSYFRLGETLCFQYMAAYFYLSTVYSIYRYCNELVVFDRERADHLYKVIPWLVSEVLSTLSINVVFPALFSVIVYFMVGMRTDSLAKNIFVLIASSILVQLGSVAFALVSASVVRELASSSLMANGTSIFFFLSAGYAIIRPPDYVLWIRYISIYWYGFRLVAISQFRGRTFKCEGVSGIALNQCTGDQVLAGLQIKASDPLWRYFVPLFGVVMGFNALAGVLLAVWKPGGVKHAVKVGGTAGKETLPESDMDIARQRVDVVVKNVGLTWIRPARLLMKEKKKQILHDITFSCPSGQITAIMGPSGAGKSSMLQLLAARSMKAGPFARFDREGSILFNGKTLSRNDSDIVSFVQQEDDYHLPALTVRETLRYAAILRLPRTMSRRSKLARAEQVITMLGLEDCADNLVGGPLLKGISGGEKRRLSLAVEMLNDPAVLIVDEVTSGLDAATANNVMLGLKSIADSGRTVICEPRHFSLTLHQPRSDIYHLLDNVVVLAKGGRTVYAGPRKQVEGTFTAQGYTIPAYFNPADFLLDIISVDNRPEFESVSRDRVNRLVEYWVSEEEKMKLAGRIEGDDSADTSRPMRLAKESRLTPMWIAGPVLLERAFRNMWRQQPVFWVRIQQSPLMGALYLLYFQRLSKGPTGGQDRIGFFQQLLGAVPFIGLLNSVAIFPAERDVFFHEYQSSAAYSTATFTLVTTLVETPFTFIANILLALLANLVAGLTTSPRIFFEFALSTFAVQSLGESVGIIFATFTPEMGLSVSLVSTVLSIITQFSGLVSLSVPKWHELA
ncbi:ABC transporter G family member 6 Short=ABC transporter ABCG.6; Short=AtABCG6; AltName: Full=White-brown complex homolog protein 6; Short=AtWBC6 [Serendipita indica DSM 11827]|nr:ABC transporter G family member 6 Short=ABC transporter ABCG.6; Short=AtABCG6; AltName: Full=White-brown complex homolog protein 6; Short=AtWBC6 [Serendipita indica DSM 11827]